MSRPKNNNQFAAMLVAVTLVLTALLAIYNFDATLTAYLTNGMGESGSHASVTAILYGFTPVTGA